MKRRSFLKGAVAAPFVLTNFQGVTDHGWRPPLASAIDTEYLCSGEGEGKITLLYRYYRMALRKNITPSTQSNVDCTSHAGSLGIEIVEALQHLLRKDSWIAPISSEILHVGARSVIGGRSSGGVAISEFAEFIQKYGLLFRKKYGDFNFAKYDYNNCEKLGNTIPPALLKRCSEHKIKTATRVANWEQARDAIHALQPVVIGSMVGFDAQSGKDKLTRDKDGFVEPNGKWAHAWLLIGIKDSGRRGGCLISSHGSNWVVGPKGLNQPDGSIWIDKPLLERMLSEYGDSYALSNLTNLKPKEYKLC